MSTTQAKLLTIENFGEVSAEDDPNLRKYFVKTPVFDALVQGRRQVVIGRKGSGKTALYLAIKNKADELHHYAIPLQFQKYPWALQLAYQTESGDRYIRFFESWRFLIMVELFKQLLAAPNRATRFASPAQKEALAAIELFIENNWGTLSFSFKDMFPGGGLSLDAVSLKPSVGIPNVATASIFDVSMKKSNKSGHGATITRLNEWLWNCLLPLAPAAPPIFMLFDDLDSGFDPQSVDYLDRLTGLLLAVRSMTRDIKEQKMPFKLIAFLRTDIFDKLHFGDKNKLIANNTIKLEWNKDLKYHNSSLKEMIDSRIREMLEIPVTDKEPWFVAFEKRYTRGTQHKFHHMTARSYMRPRDVISFCNFALLAAQKRVVIEGGQPIIMNEDVISARRPYSGYIFQELDDEIAEAWKGWEKYLEVLRRIRFLKFTRSVFTQAFNELKDQLNFDKDKSEQEVLQTLFYQYSIVGFNRVGRQDGRAGYYYHYRYMDESIRFDPNALSFRVHFGLKEYLELSENSVPIASLDEDVAAIDETETDEGDEG